jgi:hypothetical protein
MRPALDSVGHRVPRTKPSCLLHTWRPHWPRPFALVMHLHQHQSRRNLHLQYLAKNQPTPCFQSLITLVSDLPPVLEPHRLSLLTGLTGQSRAGTAALFCGEACMHSSRGVALVQGELPCVQGELFVVFELWFGGLLLFA